jgi:hypothetical protein
MLANASGWLSVAVALGALSGLRQGEVRALEVRDVDLKQGIITVRWERHSLPPRSFHSLRHYFLSAMVRGGANLEAVRELAGHSKLLTTQRYLHASGADLVTPCHGFRATRSLWVTSGKRLASGRLVTDHKKRKPGFGCRVFSLSRVSYRRGGQIGPAFAHFATDSRDNSSVCERGPPLTTSIEVTRGDAARRRRSRSRRSGRHGAEIGGSKRGGATTRGQLGLRCRSRCGWRRRPSRNLSGQGRRAT